MLALEIVSLKHFMSHLLSGSTFDSFLLVEAVISTANTYTIDGRINAEFFPPDERGEDCLPYAFQPWSEIKGLCYNLIKGKHTPLYFKFVLQLKPEAAAALLRGLAEATGLAMPAAFAGQAEATGQAMPAAGLAEATESAMPAAGLAGNFAQVKALVLNIRYDGSKAVLTTGTSCHTFVPSKEADHIWDNAFCRFLEEKGILFENLTSAS